MKELEIAGKDGGQRLDKYLKKYLAGAGSGFIYKMLRKKNITLNGKKADGSELISGGDRLFFFFSDETFEKMRGTASAAGGRLTADKCLPAPEIVYEDEDIIIMNKPAGVLSIPDGSGALCANDMLRSYLEEKRGADPAFSPAVCNRLDRNTSGMLLCAASYAGSRFLSDMIASREVGKIYLAVAEGECSLDGPVEGFLVKDGGSNTVRIVKDSSAEGAKRVCTVFRTLEIKNGYSLIEAELVTGRSHQIRAQLAYLGHPLKGDEKYGGRRAGRHRGQYLHAYRIVFPKISGAFERLSEKNFVCRPPEGFWLT
ncbi:MAG: RluA family pseudouridine synthase [Lachnospiraceae bacterium]|nr:RluA family pseudouridine synthase [Lachnospiraceae bacterium]